MSLRTLLFVVAILVIAFGLFLLINGRKSKTILKITNIGELSTSSLGLVTLVIGVVLGYFSVQVEEKNAAVAGPMPTTSSASVSQSSTGDGSPNIGNVNGDSVTIQVGKVRSDR